MIFAYIALNTENQKLKGVINAEDESGAKKKLHNVGLSVLSLREAHESEIETVTSENKKTEKNPSFVFFVIDPQGKKLSGSIEAKDKKNALRRLSEEYGFEILSLCESSIPSDMQYTEGQKGLKELEEEVAYEYGISFRHSVEGKKESKKGNKLYDEDFESERKEILKEIEMVSEKTQGILKTHRDEMDADHYTQIEHLLGDLIRLRFSNNFALIRKLIENLFEKIGETMQNIKKKRGEEDIKDFDALKEEEEMMEMMKSSAGNSHKDILGKLQGFSKSLDRFIGGEKKKFTKGTKGQEGIFDEVKEDFSFFRRISKSTLNAAFTGNSELRKKRFSEVKKRWGLWENKKKALKEKRNKILQKKEFEQRKRGMTKESEIFFFVLDEIRLFLGALLLVILLFGYISLFIIGHNIDIMRGLLEKTIHSDSIISFCIAVYFAFFTVIIQKKIFPKNVAGTVGIFIAAIGLGIVYFINI